MPFSVKSAVALAAALAAPADAFFKISCGTNPSLNLVTQRIDPIISPGGVSGHVHQVNGGNGFGFTMDYNSTQRATCTTCAAVEDKSNYWTPTVYWTDKDGKFHRVQQNGMLIYYLIRPGDGEKVEAFPPGLRMIAGNPFKRTPVDSNAGRAVSFACLNYNGPRTDQTQTFPKQNCPDGIRTQINFPPCWDGKNLDSPDHMSHMSYPVGDKPDSGSCPSSHPVHLINLFYEVFYDTPKYEFWEGKYGTGQPFVFAQGDPTGYGMHGDFITGWKPEVLQKAIDTCPDQNGVLENCKALTINSDDARKSCSLPPSVSEDIDGPLDKLPGCNDVVVGPADAKPATNCAAIPITGPKLQFTDMTAQGWAYQGCASDSTNARSLTGKNNVYSSDQATMTVETCMKTCAGSAYAGLEYGGQCFCGDNIPGDRVPNPNQFGQCNMPCKGNSSQFCGGGSQLSLYKACNGGECKNAEYQAIGDLTGTGGTGGGAAAPIAGSGSGSASSMAPAAPAMPATSKVVDDNAAATQAPAPAPVSGGTGTGNAPAPVNGGSGSGTGNGAPAPAAPPATTPAAALPSGYNYVTVTSNDMVYVTVVKTVTASPSSTRRRRKHNHNRAHKQRA